MADGRLFQTVGFTVDFSDPDEPRTTMVMRADPWALCSMVELQRLGEVNSLEVPDTHLRRELRALEQSRGLPDGQLLTDLRRTRRG